MSRLHLIVPKLAACLTVVAIAAPAALSGTHAIDPTTKNYVHVLRAGYVPAQGAFVGTTVTCTNIAIPSNRQQCHAFAVKFTAAATALVRQLAHTKVPVKAMAPNRKFLSAWRGMIAAVGATAKALDAHDNKAFDRSTARAGISIGLVSEAVDGLNRVVPAHLPPIAG